MPLTALISSSQNFETRSHSHSLKTFVTLVALVVVGLGFWVSTAKANNRVLGTAEIQSLLMGRTIKQVDDQYFAYYGQSGQVKALYVNAEETGTWQVANNQICHRWQTWNKGKTACFYVIQGQQGAYRFQDISSTDGFNFVLRSGNPQGL